MNGGGAAVLPRRFVGPIDFTVTSLPIATETIHELASRPLERGISVHCANAYNLALASSDEAYCAVMNSGAYVFCDGMPIVWAGSRLHKDYALPWNRVYGPDLMEGVLALSGPDGPAHYLLGGGPETLIRLSAAIENRWPRALVVGAESPPFGTWSSAELAQRDERIRASGASIVWVGLGTPKQDYEVQRIATVLPVVAVAVGAAFDFLSGTKAQAPKWIQRAGLEWLFRLMQEPRRLMRRYLWGNTVFVVQVLKQARRGKRGGPPKVNQ